MNLDYPKYCLGHPFSRRVIARTTISRKFKIAPPARYDIMNFVAVNCLLNLSWHSYWWSRTIWINIMFLRFSALAVKVSRIQIIKFYDKIVKVIIMVIFVANKTRPLGNSIEVKYESWVRILDFKGMNSKNFCRNFAIFVEIGLLTGPFLNFGEEGYLYSN